MGVKSFYMHWHLLILFNVIPFLKLAKFQIDLHRPIVPGKYQRGKILFG